MPSMNFVDKRLFLIAPSDPDDVLEHLCAWLCGSVVQNRARDHAAVEPLDEGLVPPVNEIDRAARLVDQSHIGQSATDSQADYKGTRADLLRTFDRTSGCYKNKMEVLGRAGQRGCGINGHISPVLFARPERVQALRHSHRADQ